MDGIWDIQHAGFHAEIKPDRRIFAAREVPLHGPNRLFGLSGSIRLNVGTRSEFTTLGLLYVSFDSHIDKLPNPPQFRGDIILTFTPQRIASIQLWVGKRQFQLLRELMLALRSDDQLANHFFYKDEISSQLSHPSRQQIAHYQVELHQKLA